ncbi:hypothetical protein THTE_1780 [Thermogutta terrifontis]|uniref:Uncharacterized protein n=1 Tax=Thermogutta terrifontis TaxID=1331910 RepID=A0A286REL4_9BACT|nr:hypothetical protein THTE_1780 [Thermogutta terrifontis]
MPGEMKWIIEPARADPTSGSLHCVDYRIGCRPAGHPGSIQAEGTVVKAKAFTEKRR